MIKVLFVCHGNICRSTMAESVMTYLVEKEGLADKFYINSAATSREEIGNGVHHGTVAKLKKEGIPVIPHRAVQMTLNDYEEYDYLIGMDTENIRNMQRISGGDPDEKIYKLLTFAGNGLDVADPWYTGDFEATYRDVLAGCKGLLECLKEELFAFSVRLYYKVQLQYILIKWVCHGFLSSSGTACLARQPLPIGCYLPTTAEYTYSSGKNRIQWQLP